MNGTLIKKDGDWYVSFVFNLDAEVQYNEVQVYNPTKLENPKEGDDVKFSPMVIFGEEDEETKHYAVVSIMPQDLRDDYIMRQSEDPQFIEGAKWMRNVIWDKYM